MNRIAEAENLLSDISAIIATLPAERQQELYNYSALTQLVIDITNKPKSEADSIIQVNSQYLQTIAETEGYTGRITAQVLLEDAGLAQYPEPYKLPFAVAQARSMNFKSEFADLYSNDDNITIYPNPADQKVTVTSTEGRAIKNVVVFNALGQEVARTGSGNSNVVIDSGNLPEGIYTLKIIYDDSTITYRNMAVYH